MKHAILTIFVIAFAAAISAAQTGGCTPIGRKFGLKFPKRPAIESTVLNASATDTPTDAKKKKKKEGKKEGKLNIPIFEAVMDGQECRPTKPTGTSRPRPTRPFGPKTKVASYETAGHICESKPWICFPDPKPPKKTKLPPKTKSAYDIAGNPVSIEYAAFADGGRPKKRATQKTSGGSTWIGEMNKHLSRLADDRYDTVSLYGIPVLATKKTVSAGTGTPAGDGGNPYAGGGGGARKGAKK